MQARLVSIPVFALFLITFAACNRGPQKPAAKTFTPEEFKAVKPGMTEQQVKDLLGEPFDSAEATGTRRLWWKVDDKYFSASFDNGNVVEPMGPSAVQEYQMMKALMSEIKNISGPGVGQQIIKPRYTQKLELGKAEFPKPRLSSLTLSPNGKILIGLASSDGDVKNIQIWDVENRKLLHAFTDNLENSVPAAIAPDNKTAAYRNSRTREIVLIDLAEGKETRKLSSKEPVDPHWRHRLFYSPQADTIALTHERGIIGWDTKTGEQKFDLKEKGEVSGVSTFFADGKRVALGLADGSINIWDTATGKPVQTLTDSEGKDRRAYHIAVSPDSKSLAVCPAYGDVRIWDLTTGKAGKQCEGGQSSWVNIEFLPDNKTVVFAGFPHKLEFMINLANIDTGKVTHRMEDAPSPKWLSLAANGAVLASAGDDGTFTIWDIKQAGK